MTDPNLVALQDALTQLRKALQLRMASSTPAQTSALKQVLARLPAAEASQPSPRVLVEDSPAESSCSKSPADEAIRSGEDSKKRKRSASISELSFKEFLSVDSPPYDMIRVWVNERNLNFYDCVCGGRKPVQDVRKIIKHVETHVKSNYQCEFCGKVYEKPMQLNAHMKFHRKRGKEDQETPES